MSLCVTQGLIHTISYLFSFFMNFYFILFNFSSLRSLHRDNLQFGTCHRVSPIILITGKQQLVLVHLCLAPRVKQQKRRLFVKDQHLSCVLVNGENKRHILNRMIHIYTSNILLIHHFPSLSSLIFVTSEPTSNYLN